MSSAPDRMTAIAIRGGKGPAAALQYDQGSHAPARARPGADPRSGRGREPPRHRCSATAAIRRRLARPTPWGWRWPGEVAAVGEGRRALADRRPGLRPARRRRLCGLCGRRRSACLAHPGRIRLGPGRRPAGDRLHRLLQRVRDRRAFRPGETLLLHGATSGIGVMAIQMAKAAGARVIATGRGADKAAGALRARSRPVDRFHRRGLRRQGAGGRRRRRGAGHGRRRLRATEPGRAEATGAAGADRHPGRGDRHHRHGPGDGAPADPDRLDPAPPKRRREGPAGARRWRRPSGPGSRPGW